MFKLFFCCAFLFGSVVHAADSSSGQRFKKVLIIVLENTDYDEALKQPFLKKMTSQGALLENMNGLTHPSQGNYLAMIGGDSFQVKNDDPVNLHYQNLIDLLEKKGLSWKGYMENYPGNCFTGTTKGRYVRKHNPFISFNNIASDAGRCANIQDLKAFAQDAAAGTLPNFSILSPDLDNDGHDTGSRFASAWLEKILANKLQDPRFMKDLLVVITFDESRARNNNHIYTVLLGDSVKPGSSNKQKLTHASLLKTIEVEFNLGSLGRLDATAPPIEGVWR